MSETENKAASPSPAADAERPAASQEAAAPAAAAVAGADSPAAAADAAAEGAMDVKEHDKSNGSKTPKAPVVVPQEESTDVNGETELTTDEAAATTPAPKTASRAGSKRKSIGGSKGGNKRKSTNRILHLDAKPGEYYIARLKSYPPWPSVICDEEMLPPALTAKRPVTTKQPDGTYFEAYADGGKRVYERTFPIMFLGSNELYRVDSQHRHHSHYSRGVRKCTRKGKTKGLIEAFKIASEGHDLEYFKKVINDHNAALQQEEEAIAAREAEKQRKAQEKADKAAAKAANQKKGKRKSIAATETEGEDEGEEVTEKKKPSKKRKKDAESDEESEKPAKTPKTGMKLKLTTPKTPANKEEGAATKKAAASVTKSGKAKGKKASEKKDAGDASPKEEEKAKLTAGEMKEQVIKRKQLVLYLRHKLQKGFLTRDQAPKEDEMPSMSQYIQKLETFKDLEVSIIRETKINKVLKGIVKLNTIPRDEEFRFRERSMALLGFWRQPLAEAEAEAEAAKRKSEPKDGVKDKKEMHKEDSLPASTPAPPDDEEVKKDKGEKTPEPTSATDKEDAKEKPSSPASATEEQKKEDATEAPADGDVEMTDADAEVKEAEQVAEKEAEKEKEESPKGDQVESTDENEKKEEEKEGEEEKKETAAEEKKVDAESKPEEKETEKEAEKAEDKKDEPEANADDS
ncbi:PWWP domain-containing protein [Ascosphaera apis ARSEF 7405]|uniref:PWWP domain-containing protein n=1 Tax=Ascosphaera apis ARSEF 7405 TaxID=392613 RepID=A0A168BC90_9EURO|nr:PWWP domain-containing protein [Ascosphaera apis ARSEF 7405]